MSKLLSARNVAVTERTSRSKSGIRQCQDVPSRSDHLYGGYGFFNILGGVSIRENRSLLLMLCLALVGLLAVWILAVIYTSDAHSKPHLAQFKDVTAYPGGSWRAGASMRLENGRTASTFDTASLSGRPYAVTFLYTHCPTICPLIGSELQAALKELGPEARKVGVVALSVDPIGDTVSTVKAWLHVHQEPSNFQYLIGPRHNCSPTGMPGTSGPRSSVTPTAPTRQRST